MKLNFDWAAKRWDDPLTGTEVVCISPNVELHFRNSYFRCTMFTRDGTKMALMSHDPDEQTPSAIWCIDLLTGETEKVFEYGGRSLSSWGFSPRSHLLHVIDITEGRAEIVQIDADAGEQRRIRPTETLASIPYAESTADDRYIFSHVSLKKIPEGTLNTDRIAMMGSAPDRNLMYRVDLNDGKTDVAFETDEWWMGHCNPNPVSTNLFMCCQEGFIWTEEYPRPENFQRQRIYNFDRGNGWTFRGRCSHGAPMNTGARTAGASIPMVALMAVMPSIEPISKRRKVIATLGREASEIRFTWHLRRTSPSSLATVSISAKTTSA